jgi:2,4-dienoyl-CoA reductase-like NADH-dependent reductase (Old Yellow Enzyme family)
MNESTSVGSPERGGHGCPAGSDHDREIPEIDLLSPLEIRGVRLRNRIAMSPMCQYVAREGLADGWRLVHFGSRCRAGFRVNHCKSYRNLSGTSYSKTPSSVATAITAPS